MKKHLILASLVVGALVPFAAFGCGDSGDSGDGSGGGSDSLLSGLSGQGSGNILLTGSGKKPEKPGDEGSGSKTNAPCGGSDKKKA